MRERIDIFVDEVRRRPARWIGAGVLIVGIHLSGGAIGMMQWHEAPPPPAAPPPVVMFDMEPIAPVPPPPQKQPDPEPVVEIPEAEIPPLPELEEFLPPPPDVQPVVELPKKPDKKKKKKKEKPKKEVVEKEPDEEKVDTPPPPHDKDFKTAQDAPSKTMQEVEQQPREAAAPSGPTPNQIAAIANAKANWAGLFNAHIIKYKEYPRAAKRRNKTGSPQVSFRMDRNGTVLDVKLVKSSGVESLDEEALAVFWRANPLPPLPPEIEGATYDVANFRIDFTLQ